MFVVVFQIRAQLALAFLVVIWLVLVQDSVVIKKVNEDLRLSSSPSVPSVVYYVVFNPCYCLDLSRYV